MRRHQSSTIGRMGAGVLVCTGLLAGHAAPAAETQAAASQAAASLSCHEGRQLMARSELYFGAGGPHYAAAWRRFLRDAVTPRFPEGFTILDGYGQWHGQAGLSREASHVLIVFYPPSATASQAIEAIRQHYRAQFKQQSVLRADSEACIAF